MTILNLQSKDIPYLAADGFCAAGGVAHGFSTRMGGVSEGIWSHMNLGSTRGDNPAHVRENYRRFCAAIGADDTRIVMSNQVHGDCVRPVTAADIKPEFFAPEGYEADGLMTDEVGIALAIFSADCIPILLYDPARRAIAAVHAGWRGTALDIGGRAVSALTEAYGCKPSDILAAIGPGISKCCFETDGDVPEAMTAAFGPAAAPHVESLGGGRYRVDLKGLNGMALARAGVPGAQIATAEDCTACLPERYWSHRVTKGVRGSQAAIIQLI